MAVHMPAVGSNANDIGLLTPGSVAKGKPIGDSFSDLLAQATSNSQPTSTLSEVSTQRKQKPSSTKAKATSSSPTIIPAKITPATIIPGKITQPKMGGAPSSTQGGGLLPECKAVPVKLERALAPEVPANRIANAGQFPPSSPVETPPEPTTVSANAATITSPPSSPTEGRDPSRTVKAAPATSVQAPAEIPAPTPAQSPAPTRAQSPTQIHAQIHTESGPVREVSAIVDDQVSPRSSLKSEDGNYLRNQNPGLAPSSQPTATRADATTDVTPSKAISSSLDKTESVTAPFESLAIEPLQVATGLNTGEYHSLTTIVSDLSPVTPVDDSMTVPEAAVDIDPNKSAAAVTIPASFLVPALADLLPDQVVPASSSEIPLTLDPKSSLRAQNAPAKENALAKEDAHADEKASQALPGPALAHPIDHSVTNATPVVQRATYIANLTSDAVHAPNVPQFHKEATEADQRQAAPASSQTDNSGRLAPTGALDRGSSDRGSLDRESSDRGPSDRGSKVSPNTSTGNSVRKESDSAAPVRESNSQPVQAVQNVPATQSRTALSTGTDAQLGAGLSAANVAKQDNPATPIASVSARPVDDTPASSGKAADGTDPSTSSAVADSLPGAIHSAKLVAQAGQSELRVGLQAGEFGNVNIRTTIAHSQVTAEISVEHSELRNLLAVELPHLESKLAAQSMQPANLVLNSYMGGGSGNSRHAYQQNANAAPGTSFRQGEPPVLPGVTTSVEPLASSSQLDVHV